MNKSNQSITIDGNSLTIKDIIAISRDNYIVNLADSAKEKINASRAWVEGATKSGKVMYGITTGFGAFKNKVITEEETTELQLNLIRSHACGVGEPFPVDTVRAIMLLRANSLAGGYSGVRLLVIEKIIEFLNNDIYPYIPSQGSVGSSGDLAPLCHMALALIGEGECLVDGKRVPTSEVLKEKNIEPMNLGSKEGLGLSNGTNVQTAVLVLAVYDAEILIDSADVISALTVEVLNGVCGAFHENVSRVRNQLGQQKVARNLRMILKDSSMTDMDQSRVQDSYSLRCIPQVHGAIRDTFEHVKMIVEREINAVTDNPLVFCEEDLVLSEGNFHGEPIAIASDILKIAIAELGSISERRTAKLIDPCTNEGLPAFLVSKDRGGLQSGLMIPQYVAAALVSENKVLAHPASVDSIPTSANQEDHVSMGTIAARQVAMMVKNVNSVLAIELLNNTQAYEFKKDQKLSSITNELYTLTRQTTPAIVEDRPFYRDMEDLAQLIAKGEVSKLLPQ